MPELHNPLVTPTILSITTGINLKTVAATTLYTVPASRKAVITEAIVHVTAATTYTVGATVSVGQNSATYNDIIPATALLALAADNADELLDTNPFVVVAASTAIKMDVSVGATATTATAQVILIGFLV
jgi:hypothetical protein